MWSQKELLALAQLTGKVNAFGNDETDEFTIVRDGRRQGIFKSWAIPVIPFLDFGNIDVLVKLWPNIIELARATDFWQALTMLARESKGETRKLASLAITSLGEWRDHCLNKPATLERSLERSRLYSWILDLELTLIFNKESLSDSLTARIHQLANRLELALSLLSPFYHLEALVGDPQWLCGSDKPPESLPGTGKLDLAALLLPAALRDYIVARKLDWNGLSWGIIREMTGEILSDRKYRQVLLNISRIAGIPPHHVLFAANTLEWIPMRVGGKKDDPLSTQEALAQLVKTISENEPAQKDKNIATVLSDLNALIRFLNWVPLIEGDRNFQGLDWTYSSVCDTANALLATVSSNPIVWKADFRPVFERKLKPQLEHLDATSAKGRFLLQLISEKRMRDAFTPQSDTDWKSRVIKRIGRSFSRQFDATRKIWPRSLVGDKPFGLSLAAEVLGPDRIVKGFVITSEEVDSFLRRNPRLWRRILQIHQEQDPTLKAGMADEIQESIKRMTIPRWMSQLIYERMVAFPDTKVWAVRSSSLEEGEARGVYATYLRVPSSKIEEAVRKCIASFFSKKAVMFRVTSRSGDLPSFAVLIVPNMEGKGGVATHIRQGKSHRIAVAVGTSAAAVTSNGKGIKSLVSDAPTDPLSTEVTAVFRELEGVFDPIQIEWVQSNSTIQLLQVDFLHHGTSTTEREKPCDFTVYIQSLREVAVIERDLRKHKGVATIVLGPKIKLDSFQGDLFSLIARFGQRIGEVKTATEVTETSHFANICRHFGIRLSQS